MGDAMTIAIGTTELHAERMVAETERAMSLHPPLNSAHEAYAVILEEVEEFWELVKINPKKLCGVEQAARLEGMRSELTQIASMCLRTIVDLGL
jgi:hypothetical protein